MFVSFLTVESVGFVLGLLYHVTGDHVEEALWDVQPPLQVVGLGGRRRAAAAGGARGREQPRELRLELGPQLGVQGDGGDHGRRRYRLQQLTGPPRVGGERRQRRRRRRVGKIWQGTTIEADGTLQRDLIL